MTYYTMAHARAHLAGLVREALAGREVVIARDDQPLVRLVPVQADPTDRFRTAGDVLIGSHRLLQSPTAGTMR